ncbi:hypothetical protein H5410_006044 [Solanum commersonii]|uniref:Fe2OG dioxygenase domain-containing protein n=1 Tax=Solanum commersonii TaxID=4109 RepID=A0A9J6A982_SOLCO|nr:hypothetical protein H5410_006044 [Solanum commersonii]
MIKIISHLWPNINNSPISHDEKKPNVLIIDLSTPNVVEIIGHACKTWGIFQVVNHGVSLELFDEVESQARWLFALPAEQKVKVVRSTSGATGYGTTRITPFFSKFMWHEGFTIMDSPLDHAKKLWPHDYQKRLAPHTDSLFLTILHQTNKKGLQILKKDQGWTSIAPVSNDALIVNVGDLLHILSNGEFPSVYHRVLVDQTKNRVSLAYFFGPQVDSMIVPLVSSEDNVGVVPKYRNVKVKEYLDLKDKHLEKVFSMIRI